MKTLKVRLNLADGSTRVLEGKMKLKEFRRAFDYWCKLAEDNDWSYFAGRKYDLVINVK